MPPAARVGDMTSHGTPLSPGPGSFNVLIGGMPAWKATSDFHTCPLVTGTVPHVGGVVVMGSPTVLINNLPAARLGDIITESGPPNTIIIGCTTVIIG
ncbi:PAAR domain-containing protein [Methanobacterium formicicum]|uniref:PAAR domain-containing protein n=1 Tax=Methanobacterium formicicum TaxID=2162 RepID=UPI002412D109|nr:PAAR domain-containing protein [Methanobacterium formicicum]MDG3548137.1 PAAR domain-containing protein [Methanobacterium formicicum]